MSESNFFKSININVGQPSLIESVINPTKVMKGASNIHDIGRAGIRSSARENLYANWGIKETDIEFPLKMIKGDEVPLKNTHGEKFHKDNDKEVEKMVTKVEEVKYPKEYSVSLSVDSCLDDLTKAQDPYIGGDKESNSDDKDEQTIEAEKEIRAEKEKKISVREFRASLDEVYNLVKATTVQQKKVHEVMSEHKEGTLHSGSKKGPKVTSRKQAIAIAMDEAGLANKSGSGNYEAAMNISDEEMAKKIKRGVHENSVGMKEKKKKPSYKSELDEIVDMVKAREEGGGTEKVKNISTSTPKRGFIKAVGPGGIQFDFGTHTGNPIADNYNSILWNNLEKTQSDIIEYQQTEHDKAVKEYVSKGKDAYMKDHVVEGVNEEKPIETSMEKSDDIRNKFHDVSVNIEGEVVKAQSETDMFVLQQHKEMFKSQEDDGQIINAIGGAGDGVVIDALTGIAYDAISGKEVEVK